MIAADLASSAVRFLERMEGRTAEPGALSRLKLTPDQVRKMAAAAAPLSPEQVRRSLAKSTRAARRDKLGRIGAWGYYGMPDHIAQAMYADYRTGKSLSEVAAIYGGTRQSLYSVFKLRGFALRPRHLHLHAKFMHEGREYTPDRDGYLRSTKKPRAHLHRVIWERAHGPLPAGWNILFEDGSRRNCALANLRAAPKREIMAIVKARQKAARAGYTLNE